MPSFGEKLRLEREKRKISLEQISSSTKIGTRMLQALEEDKFSQLPGGIFNKGFVRAYARVVGLDEDQTIADYLQASGDAPRPELVTRDGAAQDTGSRDVTARDTARDEEHRISRLEAISDEPSRPLPWGMFAVVLLVIALGLSLWSHRRREQERLAVHPSKTVQAPSTPENAAGTGSDSTPQTPPSTTGGQENPPSTNQTGISGTAPPVTPPERPTSPQSSPLQATATPAAPGEFLVLIHAREESWVSVSIDGKFSGSEVLEAGSDRTFHAHSHVVIKAGNAGGLDFQLDGKKLAVGGDYGEVKSVTIGHAGVIPNPSPPPSNP